MAEILFWISVSGLLYVFVGYPLLLLLLGEISQRSPVVKGTIRPHVTLLISAYNEEEVIEKKIRNSLALDYPREMLEIIVVSDASTDRTDNIVERYATEGVVLKRMPVRKGKTAGINDAVQIAHGEIIVFSDANAIYAEDSIQKLMRNFADPAIGCVTGNSCYVEFEESTVGKSENIYWGYDRLLKMKESQIGSMVGSDGAIFAIRKRLFSPLEAHEINDFVTPLQIVRRGYRNVFEPEALCFEKSVTQFVQEFRRKVRIVSRSWHGLFRVKALLNPLRYGWFSFQLISHKLLRWLAPAFLICVLFSSFSLPWDDRVRTMLVSGQILFYCLGGLGLLVDGAGVGSRWVSFPAYFLTINVASAFGVLKGTFGTPVSSWEPERWSPLNSTANRSGTFLQNKEGEKVD